MKGDFSRWNFDEKDNFNGVLHQQGRVLLDNDWNAATRITNAWQDQDSRDVIGPGVAAVPAAEPDSYKVQTAEVDDIDGSNQVILGVSPGRVWADGLLTYLSGEEPDSSGTVSRVAAYLEPPIQDHYDVESPTAAGTRDAVILEVWREAVNGFQMKDQLIEPALGGPDTTERVHIAAAFRLLRLAEEDRCENIREKLMVEPDQKGKLKVSLQPTIISGDEHCPVVEEGGYTGFEHHLYRIEIAQVDRSERMFKWSRFNGGLVGRGTFRDGKVNIEANFQAITTSGSPFFYLEVVEYKEESGHYQVTYGAKVTLDSENRLDLPEDFADVFFGELPGSDDPVFFRLWDDIRLISDFPVSTDPEHLENGIYLEFEQDTDKYYIPGDYWTFQVRAGGIENEEILIGKEETGGGTIIGEFPEGIRYHRVPLAILNWDGGTEPISGEQIRDCRKRFHPLTDLNYCCTVTVGAGGDFNEIQEAVNYFTGTDGGRICILPGEYHENISIENAENITICGCGERSKIISREPAEGVDADAVIRVIDSKNIRIESLWITAASNGFGILLEGSGDIDEGTPELQEIILSDLHIEAAERSAIRVYNGRFIVIRGCSIVMEDVEPTCPGIFIAADDAVIENNRIEVRTDSEDALPSAGRGGLHIGGTSDRVRIIDNLIRRGRANGITLGHLIEIDEDGTPVGETGEPGAASFDDCYRCWGESTYVSSGGEGESTTWTVTGGDLSEIHIQGNRIFDMGLNGIGVVGFFELDEEDQFITINRLTITDNEIRGCAYWSPLEIPGEMLNSMGYGGIVLADVDYLVIRGNIIEENGTTHDDPICGIFVLHAEGIDIFNNRISNNGKSLNAVKAGPRGGIYIAYAVTPGDPYRMPAARIHDNIVSAPLGRALFITALGSVSVVGNQLVSRGVVLPRMVTDEKTPTLRGAVAAIVNLGVSHEFYGEITFFHLLAALGKGIIKRKIISSIISEDSFLFPLEAFDHIDEDQNILNGNILFSSNQCQLEPGKPILNIFASAILIITQDDIGFNDNQCDLGLSNGLILSQAILLGISLRVNNNRFTENFLFSSLFSAITLGFLNMTTHNQATHCLWVNGLWGEDSPNTVTWTSIYSGLWDLLGRTPSDKIDFLYCKFFKNIFGKWLNKGENN